MLIHKEELVTIDLSRLLTMKNRLSISDKYELKLVEMYNYKHQEDTITNFTNYVLGCIYYEHKEYQFTDINTFYKEKQFTHVILSYIDMLEIIILNSIEPDFIDIKFSKYITNSDNKLIVEYIVSKVEHE